MCLSAFDLIGNRITCVVTTGTLPESVSFEFSSDKKIRFDLVLGAH